MRSLRSFLRVMIRSPTLGPVAIGQRDLPSRSGAGEAVVAGPLVEDADQLAGRGQHDGVAAVAAVGLPRVEGGVKGGGRVADVDALPVEVEADCFGRPSRTARVAAASAGSANRCSSLTSEGADEATATLRSARSASTLDAAFRRIGPRS